MFDECIIITSLLPLRSAALAPLIRVLTLSITSVKEHFSPIIAIPCIVVLLLYILERIVVRRVASGDIRLLFSVWF